MADVRDKLALARSLFEAVTEGSADRVATCLSKSVHPDGYVTEDGMTALMMAAKLGLADVVPQLLSVGAKPAHRNRAGESARDLAKKGGHEAVLKLLPAEEGKSSGSSLFAVRRRYMPVTRLLHREWLPNLARAPAGRVGIPRALSPAQPCPHSTRLSPPWVQSSPDGEPRPQAAKSFANKAVQKADALKADLQRGSLSAEEYDAMMKKSAERKRAEAAEKVAELQASKRRAIEQVMRRKAQPCL